MLKINDWSKRLPDRSYKMIIQMISNNFLMPKPSITTILNENYERRKSFKTKEERSGIIGRILQPKGWVITDIHYCHTVYYIDIHLPEVDSPSSAPSALETIVCPCRPCATEYITACFCTDEHQVRSYLTIW